MQKIDANIHVNIVSFLDLVMKFLINENQLKVGGSDLNEIK